MAQRRQAATYSEPAQPVAMLIVTREFSCALGHDCTEGFGGRKKARVRSLLMEK
jgi:hypothetical protein